MWTPCPRNLDEPVRILGLEPEDLATVVLTLTLTSAAWSLIPAMAAAALVGLGLWRAKRGKPPGALIHACHRLELLPIAGVLRPGARRHSPW